MNFVNFQKYSKSRYTDVSRRLSNTEAVNHLRQWFLIFSARRTHKVLINLHGPLKYHNRSLMDPKILIKEAMKRLLLYFCDIHGLPVKNLLSKTVFLNVFCLAAPLVSYFNISRHPQMLKQLQRSIKVITGGTSDTISRHPSVPRHPG